MRPREDQQRGVGGCFRPNLVKSLQQNHFKSGLLGQGEVNPPISEAVPKFSDATALRRGASRLPLQIFADSY